MPLITILEQNQDCCLSFFDFRSSFEKSKPPFLFIFWWNDAVSLLKAAAKGGSRHEAHTLSTKSDGHWHIKKSPPTTGENYACIYELSNHLNTAYNTYAPVRAFRTGAFCCSKNFLKKFISNFLLFLFVLFILGLFIKENGFTHNFLCLSIIGQGLNIFDLFIVDLLWWRNTKRVRLRKMPEKELYQNPKKHIEAFIRAFIMYLLIALIDGYILTLL